jgi:hypothetical protein
MTGKRIFVGTLPARAHVPDASAAAARTDVINGPLKRRDSSGLTVKF